MNHSSDRKIKKDNLSSLLIYALSVTALIVFLYGFFPFKYSTNSRNISRHSVNKIVQKRYIDKLALIVIDALRYDFVAPENGEKYMPFVKSSIESQEACYMVAKAHSPTVTLPRLKALTSGTVSTYIDVVLNFMTPAFVEDNFISSAVSHGLKAVFYGDDTWLRLFPHSFLRSEGTNSFFAYDYFEADNNVTRHIDEELNRKDWDIIILHYLGLDHIGHTEGPNSPLVKPKLLEMDKIIKKFDDHFKKLEKNEGLKTMLIVTSDHGMKDSGGHGGVTYPEVTVPLLSLGHPCLVLPGWPQDHIPLQIDLSPTLTTVFGLPISRKNMGKILPPLLHSVPREDIPKYLEVNRLELEKLRGSSNDDSEVKSLRREFDSWMRNDNKNKESEKNLIKKYFERLNKLSTELVTTNSDFRFLFLIAGVISLWISTLLLVFEFAKKCPRPQRCIHWFFLLGTALHTVSLQGSSFIEEEHQTWYFLWATFCVLAFVEALNFSKNSSVLLKMKLMIPWIVLGVLHRVLRKLNQTGDKWAFLPDIKFYLYSGEGQSLLFFVFLCGIAFIFVCALCEKCSTAQLITCGLCLLIVLLYRITTGNLKLEYSGYASSRGLTEVFFFWIFLSIFTIQSAFNQTPFYLVWLLFSALFHRPHNVILLSMQVFCSKQLHELFHKPEDLVWNSLAHVWLGNVFYFYQGNGNSLSNVDVAAGFVGVKSYEPVYAGLMIAANTFCSQILSFILSAKVNTVFALLRILPVTFYSTVLMFLLNHLFIWSVFSPKLLFESSITLIFLVLMLFHQLVSIWKLFRKQCTFKINLNKHLYLVTDSQKIPLVKNTAQGESELLLQSAVLTTTKTESLLGMVASQESLHTQRDIADKHV